MYRDKEIVLDMLKQKKESVENIWNQLSEEMKNDWDICVLIAKEDEMMFNSMKFKDNIEFVSEVIQHNPSIAEYLNEELKKDKDIALKAAEHPNISLDNFASNITSDFEVVAKALHNGDVENFEVVSEVLRENPEIIKLTCDKIEESSKKYPISSYELEWLKNVKENNPKLKEAINERYKERLSKEEDVSLTNLTVESRNLFDEIIHTNVLYNNNELTHLFFENPQMREQLDNYFNEISVEEFKRFAHEVLKDDIDLNISCIREMISSEKYENIQEFLDDSVTENPKVIAQLLHNNFPVVISDEKKNDINYNIELSNFIDLHELRYHINPQIFENVEFMRELLESGNILPPEVLSVAPEELRDNPDFVNSCVISYGEGLQYASDRLRANKEFVKNIISSCYGYGVEHVSDELKRDPEFLMDILKMNDTGSYTVLLYASDELKFNPDFITEAIKVTKRKYNRFN